MKITSICFPQPQVAYCGEFYIQEEEVNEHRMDFATDPVTGQPQYPSLHSVTVI